jgi:hypothetical protein
MQTVVLSSSWCQRDGDLAVQGIHCLQCDQCFPVVEIIGDKGSLSAILLQLG